MSSNYVTPIGLGNILIGHATLPPVCRDSDLQLERESRIRSGNYFETVATELENLAHSTNDQVLKSQIETLINELLYLQEHYQLIKKSR